MVSPPRFRVSSPPTTVVGGWWWFVVTGGGGGGSGHAERGCTTGLASNCIRHLAAIVAAQETHNLRPFLLCFVSSWWPGTQFGTVLTALNLNHRCPQTSSPSEVRSRVSVHDSTDLHKIRHCIGQSASCLPDRCRRSRGFQANKSYKQQKSSESCPHPFSACKSHRAAKFSLQISHDLAE